MFFNILKLAIHRLIILLLSSMVLTAHSAEQEVLRLLVWGGYAPKSQQEKFRQFIADKYSINLTITVSYIAEPEDGFEALRLKKADIVSPAHNRINDKRFRMIDSGLLLPLQLENFSNLKQLDPSFKNLDHLIKDNIHYGLPFAWGPYGLIYNSKLINTPPTSLNILWNPRYSNQLSIANIGEINVFLTALAMGYDKNSLADLNQLDNHEFIHKLAALVSQAKTMWVGVDNADDNEGLALSTSWGFSLAELHARGENWKWVYPKEGVPGWIDNHVISKAVEENPQLQRIAEEWLNFTISKEFQKEVLVETLATHPVNKLALDASTKLQKQLFYASSMNDPEASIILMPMIDRRTRNGMNLMWEKAIQLSQKTEPKPKPNPK